MVSCYGLINKNGRKEFLSGSENVLPKERQEMLLMQFALMASIQNEMNKDLGLTKHIIVKRESAQFILIPCLDSKTLVIALDQAADPSRVLDLLYSEKSGT